VRAASAGHCRRLAGPGWTPGGGTTSWKPPPEVDDFFTGYQMDIVGPSPRGAQVRRTAGSSDTPDSSQNTMAARWGRQACGRPDEAGAAQCLQPARRPAGVPAAGVLPGGTQGVSDLGLGAAGGKQFTNRTSRLPAMPGSTSLALRGAGFVEGQPVGSIGGLEDREAGTRAEPSRRVDSVPLPRP
jgi:hypothetical protein